MRRLVVLAAVVLAACTSASGDDAGTDLGAAYCLGGGFPACTDRTEVPVCAAGACTTCTPDGRVVCGVDTPVTLPDLGVRARCVADPTTAPAATCTSVCTLDPTACADAGAP